MSIYGYMSANISAGHPRKRVRIFETPVPEKVAKRRATSRAARAEKKAARYGNSGVPKARFRGNPAVSDREYNPAELEFILAIGHWQDESHTKYPTWPQVLAIAESLGYTKREQADEQAVA